MGPQMPLSFDDWAAAAMPAARRTDPATSHAAAHSVRSIASEHHTRIIGALYTPATATEIAAATGLTMVQVCRRLPEMEALGIARPTGKTRATASGRQSREWERVK